MRALIIFLSMLLLPFMGSAAQADTRMDIGATIVDGNLRGFYLALGEYYRVPERDVLVIRDRHIRDHDIPVVLFLAQRVHVAPGVIIDMRLAGRSWMDITLHFGLGPDIYYIPVSRDYGPPYGHAYGHFKHKHRKDWHKIRLADDDVVNLVNLRFMSEHYGRPADEVIRMRSGGRDFIGINEEFQRGRKDKEYREQDRRESRSREQQGGQGKGKWKDKSKSDKHPGKGRGREDD